MQAGNLKVFVPQKEKPSKFGWIKWLNPLRYLPSRLYKDFLKVYAGFQGVQTYYYYDTFPEIHQLPSDCNIKTKELPRDKACVHQFDLKSAEKLSYSLDFSAKRPQIFSGLEFGYGIKWVFLNFKRAVQLRTASVRMTKQPAVKVFCNFDLKSSLKKKFFPREDFEIENSVESVDVLLEIAPYIKSLSVEKMYSVAIEKAAMNKNFIEISLLEKFRQHLSTNAKTNSVDMKILHVYENVKVELYKDIKHHSAKNLLLCYLNEYKINVDDAKDYYLVLGQRISDGKVFTIVSEK